MFGCSTLFMLVLIVSYRWIFIHFSHFDWSKLEYLNIKLIHFGGFLSNFYCEFEIKSSSHKTIEENISYLNIWIQLRWIDSSLFYNPSSTSTATEKITLQSLLDESVRYHKGNICILIASNNRSTCVYDSSFKNNSNVFWSCWGNVIQINVPIYAHQMTSSMQKNVTHWWTDPKLALSTSMFIYSKFLTFQWSLSLQMTDKKRYFYEVFMVMFCVLPVTSSMIVSGYLFRLTREKRNASTCIGQNVDTPTFKNKVFAQLLINSITYGVNFKLLSL